MSDCLSAGSQSSLPPQPSRVVLGAKLVAAGTFDSYEFLWKTDMQQEYEHFMATKPSLEEFELQLKRFMDIEQVGMTRWYYAASGLCLMSGANWI